MEYTKETIAIIDKIQSEAFGVIYMDTKFIVDLLEIKIYDETDPKTRLKSLFAKENDLLQAEDGKTYIRRGDDWVLPKSTYMISENEENLEEDEKKRLQTMWKNAVEFQASSQNKNLNIKILDGALIYTNKTDGRYHIVKLKEKKDVQL